VKRWGIPPFLCTEEDFLVLLLNMIKAKVFVSFLMFLVYQAIIGAPLSHLDSLIIQCQNEKEDSSKMKLFNEIAACYNGMGYANAKAVDAAQEALSIAIKNNYKGGQIWAYLNTGYYFQLMGDLKQALDNFLKAQDIAEKNRGKDILAEVYDRLSQFYNGAMRNYKKALEYSQKELSIRKESGNENGYAVALVNTGNIYYGMDSSRQALKYYIEAANHFSTLHQKSNLADVENNTGSVYADLKEYDKAILYYQKALSTYQEMNNKYGIAMCYGNIGNVYNMNGEAEKGVTYSEQSLQLAREINSKDNVESAYTFLAEGYSKLGDYKKAFEYQSDLANLKDTIFNETSAKQINDMQVKYDTDKKEKENQILSLSINKQRIISYAVLAGLVLVMALAFFIYRGYRDKHKANTVLAEKNKIIEEKNKDITDSINYAQRIQKAILTTDEYLKEALGEYFILYKPRDVVSGDFYWCYANHTKVIIAVADCTGHGVPGAFMSMIGNSLLNEIVIENKIADAADILNALRANLLKTLQQKGQNSVTRDGMDIVLCVWDKTKKELQYAGANNPLYVFRKNGNGEIAETKKIKKHTEAFHEIGADKQPIGYMEDKMDKTFNAHTIAVTAGDVIYLTTDGYGDQFGGESNKKFTKKRFRETLGSVAEMELAQQKEAISKAIESWMDTNTQTDDICVMGIRIS